MCAPQSDTWSLISHSNAQIEIADLVYWNLCVTEWWDLWTRKLNQARSYHQFLNLCAEFEDDHRQNSTDDLSALELPFLVALPPLSLDVEDPHAQANGLPGSRGRS